MERRSPNWKGNVGNQSICTEVPMLPRYRRWVDECAQLFGGLDICAVDAVISKHDGTEYILELNDTAIGLLNSVENEDLRYMRDVCLMRLNRHLSEKPSKSSVTTPPGACLNTKDQTPVDSKAIEAQLTLSTDSFVDTKKSICDERAPAQEDIKKTYAVQRQIDELEVYLAAEKTKRLQAEALLLLNLEEQNQSRRAKSSINGPCCQIQ